MATNPLIPSAQQPIAHNDLTATTAWFRYWQDLSKGSGGTQGPQGAQGAAGPQGTSGAQGSAGAQGAQGSFGPYVPTFIASGDTFTVPAFQQALWAFTIDNEGTIVVDGELVEVD